VTTLIRILKEKAKAAGAKTNDLVSTSERAGPIHEAKLVERHFKPLLVSAGLPNIRLYDLRHTAATLALAAGVLPKVVSEQLGHA
jgi:integrase